MDLGQMGVTPEMIQSIAQQLGLDPDALMQQAQQNPEIVQQIAQMVQQSSAESGPPDAEAEEEAAEDVSTPTAEEEVAEGEAPPASAQPPTSATPPTDEEAALPENAQLAQGAQPTMPPRGMPPGGGGQMDELISAAMMQQAGGNPNMPVPSAAMGRMPRPQMPSSGARQASGDPAAKSMISNIYRQIAQQNAAADRTGVKSGPRGPSVAASSARGRRRNA